MGVAAPRLRSVSMIAFQWASPLRGSAGFDDRAPMGVAAPRLRFGYDRGWRRRSAAPRVLSVRSQATLVGACTPTRLPRLPPRQRARAFALARI